MKITSIEIVEFGKLRNKKFTFDDALTLIRGDNESGKSTLLLFIKFMLYGISKRQKNAPVAEADRALSWDTDCAEGSMSVTHEGKSYKITRRLRKTARSTTDKLEVVCVDNGTVCEGISSPGEFFLGIPADVYESTSSISQLGAGAIKGESVATAAQNLASNADETINTERTLKAIEALRVKYLHKVGKGGTIYETEARLDYLRGEYRRAVDANVDTEKIKGQLEELKTRLAEVSEKQKNADELVSKINVLTVVKLFDKLHEYEKTRDAYQNDVATKKTALTKNGFVADRKYLAELKNLAIAADVAKQNYENELARYESEASKDEKAPEAFERVEAAGGPHALEAKIVSKKKNIKIFFIAGAALTLGFGVAAAFLPALLAGLVPAAILLVLGIYGCVSIKKYCASFGFTTANYSEYLTECKESIISSEKRRARLEALCEMVDVKKGLYINSVKNLEAHLSHYTQSTENAHTLFSKVRDELTEALDAIDAAENLLSLENAKIGELARELEPYNEHKIRGKISPEVLEMSDEEATTAKREKNYYDVQIRALSEKKNILERSLVEKNYIAKDPFAIAEEIQTLEAKAKVKREEYEAIVLASKAISEASANMRGTLTPKLRALSNEYMSELTAGKYTTVGLSDRFDVTMSADGFMRHLDAFSTGTKDAAYISLRLALLEVLSEGALPPVFMDETLAMIDDKRAHKVLEVLSKYCRDGGQCFLFSCHDREERLCDYHEIKHTVIEL